ncbi:MAG: T9SS type A sorting domain-containing protein [Bacteroidota bacterium]
MRYLPTISLALLFILAGATAQGQRDLAIVGSSTSACFGASTTDSCYVGRLRTFFNKQAPNDTSIDNGYAVGGYTVYKGMPTGYVPPYSDPSLQPDPGHNITAALASHPNIVLINYPTNGYDFLPVDSIMFCLRTIRDVSNQAGVPCFVTTTQPRTSPPFNTSVIKAKLAELKDSVLAEFGYFAIDFYTDLINPADSSIRYDAGDGTHMNDIGHDSLALRVIRKNIFLATLPATFLQFNTVYKNNANVVTWSTAKETDVDYYEIQRSSDGTNFSKIATVNANNSYGNNQYQFTDEQPLKGYNYYKILIVDKDGKKHASPVMAVYISTGKLSLVKTYLKSSSQVVVQLQNNEPQNVEIQILNNMGMILCRESRKIEAGNTTLFMNTPLLSNGVYHVKLTTAKESLVDSFIKN